MNAKRAEPASAWLWHRLGILAAAAVIVDLTIFELMVDPARIQALMAVVAVFSAVVLVASWGESRRRVGSRR